MIARIRRDVASGLASGEVRGTPTMFIDGAVHRVASPARKAAALRFPARRVAEEDSLHTAMSDGPAANHGHLSTVDT